MAPCDISARSGWGYGSRAPGKLTYRRARQPGADIAGGDDAMTAAEEDRAEGRRFAPRRSRRPYTATTGPPARPRPRVLRLPLVRAVPGQVIFSRLALPVLRIPFVLRVPSFIW